MEGSYAHQYTTNTHLFCAMNGDERPYGPQPKMFDVWPFKKKSYPLASVKLSKEIKNNKLTVIRNNMDEKKKIVIY